MNQLASCCDVVFANSYFEFGRFLPVLFLGETKHILPVFILTCLSNFLAPPIWRCFFMSEICCLAQKQKKRKPNQRFALSNSLPN
ncbi:hypothetical protein EJ063_13145 [Vibrio aquaticus]|uniref:Uncharacterized protein n=1 Tax=Vibrio aquaticus TaxID=2496559 RepID=A0A432CUV6_9VIBR|nr:hypothetical protein EJ063_13145 [Vibrio aquaticus]